MGSSRTMSSTLLRSPSLPDSEGMLLISDMVTGNQALDSLISFLRIRNRKNV